MEFQKDDKHRTRFILCLNNKINDESYEILNNKALYLKKTQAKRGGHLIECSNVYEIESYKNITQKLSRAFLIDDMFSGINHTFLFVGLPSRSHYETFIGSNKQPGIPICLLEQMIEQANRSYRVNTNIYASFIAQYHNQLWDMLSVEDLCTTMNEKEGYVNNLTELRLHDMCYFMSMFRIALRKSINWPDSAIQYAIRLRVLSYDEDKECLMESTNHFIWDGSSDPILNSFGSNSTNFQKYLSSFVKQCKLYVICNINNDKQTLLSNAGILQAWSKLKNNINTYKENVKKDEIKEYQMRMNQIDSNYNCLDRFLHQNLTIDHLQCFFRQDRYQSHRLLELLDETMNTHCKQLHDRLAELEKYRMATSKILKQRLIRQTNVINSENTVCLLQEPLSSYPNLSKVAVIPEIIQVITKLKRNTHIRLVNIRNMIKATQHNKNVVLSILESFGSILDQWNCLFFDEGRWSILENYPYGRNQSRFMQWVRSRLRMFKALWRHSHIEQENEGVNRMDMSMLVPSERRADSKIIIPKTRERLLTLTKTEQSRQITLKQKSHSNNATFQNLEAKTPIIRLKLPKVKF